MGNYTPSSFSKKHKNGHNFKNRHSFGFPYPRQDSFEKFLSYNPILSIKAPKAVP
jgi:hypothetical protein